MTMKMRKGFLCGSFSSAPLLISWLRPPLPPLPPPKPRPRMSSRGRSALLSSCPAEGASFLCLEVETLCPPCSTSAFPSAASVAWPIAFLSPDCGRETGIDLGTWIGGLCLEAIEISSRGPSMASEASSSPKSLSPPDHIFRQRDASEVEGRLGRCTRTPMTSWAAAWTGQAYRTLPQISWDPGPPPCLSAA